MRTSIPCLLILLMCFSLRQKAQKIAIDSLEKLLGTTVHDTVRINALAQLSREYSRVDIQRAEQHAREAIALADKTKFRKWRIKALAALASVEMDKGNHEESEKLFNEALSVARSLSLAKTEAGLLSNLALLYHSMNRKLEAIHMHLQAAELNRQLKNEKDLGKNLNNLGNVYREQQINDSALKYYLESISIRERIQDKAGLSTSYKNLALIYSSMDQYDESLKLQRQGIKIDKELGNKKGIATAYNNMGVEFRDRKLYDSALHYLTMALSLREELKMKGPYARTLLNIGQLYINKKDYNAGEKYLLQALPLTIEAHDYAARLLSLCELSNIASAKKDINGAIDYANQCIDLAEKINATEVITDARKSIASLYFEKGDYKKAYSEMARYADMKDSVHLQSRDNIIVEMSKKYETEKKDKELLAKNAELKIQEADNKKKAMQRNGFIAGFVLMLCLAFLIFKGYRQKQKANEIITEQKKEVEKQKSLVEEHQKEIIDSITYAKRLQEAILPPVSLISEELPDSFVFYKPKDIVAGDFYWFEKRDDVLLIAAADCTGHGVPGAMVSVVCSNALNRSVKEFGITDPGKILDKTRELVIETFEKSESEVKDGMDISLCSINKKTSEIKWSGANNPLWYTSTNENKTATFIKDLSPDKQPIGKHAAMHNFTTHLLQLKKGQSIYIFTDGYADQFGGPKGKKYKYKQLQELLLESAHLPGSDQKELLNRKFLEWKGSLEQIDDVCVIGIRI